MVSSSAQLPNIVIGEKYTKLELQEGAKRMGEAIMNKSSIRARPASFGWPKSSLTREQAMHWLSRDLLSMLLAFVYSGRPWDEAQHHARWQKVVHKVQRVFAKWGRYGSCTSNGGNNSSNGLEVCVFAINSHPSIIRA